MSPTPWHCFWAACRTAVGTVLSTPCTLAGLTWGGPRLTAAPSRARAPSAGCWSTPVQMSPEDSTGMVKQSLGSLTSRSLVARMVLSNQSGLWGCSSARFSGIANQYSAQISKAESKCTVFMTNWVLACVQVHARLRLTTCACRNWMLLSIVILLPPGCMVLADWQGEPTALLDQICSHSGKCGPRGAGA
jgi:hypothetical protein